MGESTQMNSNPMLVINTLSHVAKTVVVVCTLVVAATAQATCAFNAPQDWSQSATRWEGSCRSGRANGLGILKEYTEQKVTRFYFGRFKDGHVEIGVIEETDGYLAGRFVNGSPVPTEDPQVTIDAFTEAEKAASQAAARYANTGNKTSAMLYKNKAKKLAMQMD
jgi:hypothetical protein